MNKKLTKEYWTGERKKQTQKKSKKKKAKHGN
jgi:hypothetical protein